jgi:hypothetical protein
MYVERLNGRHLMVIRATCSSEALRTERYLCVSSLPANCLGGRLVNQARMFGSPVYIYTSHVCFFFKPVAAVGVECANLIPLL